MKYEPKDYWEQRLAKDFSLSGVGYLGLGKTLNKWRYRAMERNVDWIFNKHALNIRNKRILDIGCGTGFWIDYYLRKGGKDITGVDITEIAVDSLKKRYRNLKFYRADITKEIPVKDKFDITFAFEVLHHIVNERDFDNAIENIREMSKKDSYILISDNFLRKYRPPTKDTHSFSRTYDRYKKELEKNGIEIIDRAPIFYFLNQPEDINNNLIRKCFVLGWQVTMKLITRFDFSANIMGFLLYHLDGMILQFVKDSISSEVIVCRVKNEKNEKKINPNPFFISSHC